MPGSNNLQMKIKPISTLYCATLSHFLQFVIPPATLQDMEFRVALCLQAGGNHLHIYQGTHWPGFVFIGTLFGGL
jgi:hypothetical protein